MTDQEATELFDGIIEKLRLYHLSEIVIMIEDQITEGKVVEDQVTTFKESLNARQGVLPLPGAQNSYLKAYGKGSFSTVISYTPKEQLEILINTIEQKLFTPLWIQEYLKSSFLERRSLKRLEFTSPMGETLVRIDQKDQINYDQIHSLDLLKKVLDVIRKDL